MRIEWREASPWLAGWLVVVLAGVAVIVREDIAQRREAFRADARVAHRLLSQRAAEQEAILETLTLLQPRSTASGSARVEDAADGPERRLPALYPQIVSVLRREGSQAWPPSGASTAGDDMRAAEERSRQMHRVALGPVHAAARQFVLVSASLPASFAIVVDVSRMVPWDDWPIERSGPVRVGLGMGGSTIELQPGQPPALRPAGLTAGFVFSEPLSSQSQPFVLSLQRATGPVQWPWAWLAAWLVSTAAIALALAARQRSRRRQRRAEELLRVGQVARLNAMGELAGGVAHELNQPLAAMLANTQAARRLLVDDPPDLETALGAMEKAAAQARRAADVLARLRRLVEAKTAEPIREPVPLAAATRQVIDLLGPQLRHRGIVTSVEGPDVAVSADPVALEQIVHNLVNNAMQALEAVPVVERGLDLKVEDAGDGVLLAVSDTGPGIAPDRIDHVFEPFRSTRHGGLGLGLSLSQSLAEAMDGTLTVRHAKPRGVVFVLQLKRYRSTP